MKNNLFTVYKYNVFFVLTTAAGKGRNSSVNDQYNT